jgi:hypothetical protein
MAGSSLTTPSRDCDELAAKPRPPVAQLVRLRVSNTTKWPWVAPHGSMSRRVWLVDERGQAQGFHSWCINAYSAVVLPVWRGACNTTLLVDQTLPFIQAHASAGQTQRAGKTKIVTCKQTDTFCHTEG